MPRSAIGGKQQPGEPGRGLRQGVALPEHEETGDRLAPRNQRGRPEADAKRDPAERIHPQSRHQGDEQLDPGERLRRPDQGVRPHELRELEEGRVRSARVPVGIPGRDPARAKLRRGKPAVHLIRENLIRKDVLVESQACVLRRGREIDVRQSKDLERKQDFRPDQRRSAENRLDQVDPRHHCPDPSGALAHRPSRVRRGGC